LILLISEKGDLGAKPDPAADPINHEQRKAPAIISLPPVIFIISLRKRNWTEELMNPIIKRFVEMSVAEAGMTGTGE
jgi:hypothetical protein